MSNPSQSLSGQLEDSTPPAVWVIQPPRQRVWLHIVLLLATFLTTMIVGAGMQDNFLHSRPVFSLAEESHSLFPIDWILQQPSNLLLGLPFSLTLMFILLAHEMGHYLYSRHYRVYATLPYFIPFPSLIGTLGAFIRIKSPIPSHAALFDIGVAGPIAGFIPACGALVYGLSLSHPLANRTSTDLELGFPLAFQWCARFLHLGAPLGSLSFHPIATAAWVGMFATALNLLPGGQLDGGHILYSISPRLHRTVSILTVLALIPLARYFWTGWLLWSVLLAMTMRHPPVEPRPAVRGGRRIIAAFALLMLVLSFTPAPFNHASARDVWPELKSDAREFVHTVRDKARHLLHKR